VASNGTSLGADPRLASPYVQKSESSWPSVTSSASSAILFLCRFVSMRVSASTSSEAE